MTKVADSLEDVRRWLPTNAQLQGASPRTPEQTSAVWGQFHTDSNPRYRPEGPGVTWCNIFCWDVTRALGCEIPHWVHLDGSPAEPGAPSATEMRANHFPSWLDTAGRVRGWVSVGPAEAHRTAQLGEPVIACWVNPSGPGHVALVIAHEGADLWVVQAGRVCGVMTLVNAFGSRTVRFWRHP